MTSLTALRRVAYYWLYGADAMLGRVIEPGMRVLDVGCSDGRGSEVLSRAQSYGVDIYRPALEAAEAAGRRRPVTQADVRDLPFMDGSFDVVVSLDVVEHFEKADAHRVLREMERVSRSTVVVVTPRGFVPQPGTADEPWQEHKCGFDPGELTDLGYEVTGLGGPAVLRGPYGTFRGGPLGQAATAVCVPAAKRRPQHAFALLGVKALQRAG
jgi:SAM-dependent methyltransferase